MCRFKHNWAKWSEVRQTIRGCHAQFRECRDCGVVEARTAIKVEDIHIHGSHLINEALHMVRETDQKEGTECAPTNPA